MSQCWYENPAHRPAFSVIRHQLDLLLGHQRNYLDLDNLDTSSPSAAAAECPGTVPLPSSVQLVYADDDDDDDDDVVDREDSYVDSNPLLADEDSPSCSHTSTSSSQRNLDNSSCRV